VKMNIGRSKSKLKTVERMARFYTSTLDKDTAVQNLTTYITDNVVSAVKECENLQWCKIKSLKLVYNPPNGKRSAMQPSGQE
jgi:hypothetical protein